MVHKTAYIYIHTNKINGKSYVGQTITNPKLRWGKNGIGYYKQPKFYNAILKYGWDNFYHTVFTFHNITRDNLNTLEIEYISKYNTYNKGYNSDIGGSSNSKSSQKIYQYSLDGKYIRDWISQSEASRITGIPQANIGKNIQGLRFSAGGFIWSKIKVSPKPYVDPRNKPILQFSKNGKFIKVWNSTREASLFYNTSEANIYSVLNNKTKSAGGFVWRYEGEDF